MRLPIDPSAHRTKLERRYVRTYADMWEEEKRDFISIRLWDKEQTNVCHATQDDQGARLDAHVDDLVVNPPSLRV